MLYPQMSPYDSNRMSTYSAPEHLEHSQYASFSQPNTPAYPPTGWSALPSRSDEPSPVGIPRSPTYPPAGRRRMHSAAGLGDAAFEDEQDFRLFVEATAGLPPDIGGFSPSQQQQQQSQGSPRRRATTQGRQSSVPAVGVSEMSPVAETPTTMSALQQLASIPQANQTYRPQTQAQTQGQPQYRAYEPQRSVSQQQTTRHESRPQRPEPHRTDSATNRERLAASASGLDLWLPSPVSPQTATTPTQTIPRRPVGSSTARAASVSSHYSAISPLTPDAPPHPPQPQQQQHLQPHAAPPALADLDDEITRQLEELELEEEQGEGREYDDELPDYAQSQAEAQAERRAEAARRARELQERWLRRGR